MDETLDRLRHQVNAALWVDFARMLPDEIRRFELPSGFHMRIGDFLIRDERKAREESLAIGNALWDEDGP